jgi:hypothetical protein
LFIAERRFSIQIIKMKTLKITTLFALSMIMSNFAFAQNVKESFKVSGNCGMCKTKIEKAAKDAGATTASWDAESKLLSVEYKSTSTNTAKIQEKIAGVGYDNAGYKAKSEVYDKLHGCCKYERSGDTNKDACCASGTECKDHDKHKAEGKADCCNDGKCTKPGHNGKDCCKKSE